MTYIVIRRLLCRGCVELRVVASCEHAGNNLSGEWKEDEMRELHCACGNRLVAERTTRFWFSRSWTTPMRFTPR
jgi:hypothetical protein